jgi:hypothetical protein
MRIPDFSIIQLTHSGKECTGIRFKFCPPTDLREKLLLAGFRWDRDSRIWIIHCILEPYKIYSLIEEWPNN